MSNLEKLKKLFNLSIFIQGNLEKYLAHLAISFM